MLYHCLIDLLSKFGKSKVSVWNIKYKFNGLPSGNLLLKLIIRESNLDKKTATTSIRAQLASLDTYIGTIRCDITKLNAPVKLLLAGLSARGKIINDLVN